MLDRSAKLNSGTGVSSLLAACTRGLCPITFPLAKVVAVAGPKMAFFAFRGYLSSLDRWADYVNRFR
jgi:hypothetical protein